MDCLTIRAPDDWHVHLRDGAILRSVLPWTTRHFMRALVMPNLQPPLTSIDSVIAYKTRIEKALLQDDDFTPFMTLYLTADTNPQSVVDAYNAGYITAVKLYPAGATTNSDQGVANIEQVFTVLEAMSDNAVPLCIHGEVTDDHIDIFDREAVFINNVLHPVHKRFPKLKIVLEHITTIDAIEYVCQCPNNVVATITPHHLMITRNHILVGGIKPHYYCLPIAKAEKHKDALCAAAVSGSNKFFLGTDSAPHTNAHKESACGCAGLFCAPNALSCLAHVFEQANALEHLEGFTSIHGAQFYGVPLNSKSIKLIKAPATTVPKTITTEAGAITVFDPNVALHWCVEGKQPPII